jgi:DNA polymerase III alpha subunit
LSKFKDKKAKKQDYFDSKVLDIFRNGDTVGIFQFSSYGMRETLKKMDVEVLVI